MSARKIEAVARGFYDSVAKLDIQTAMDMSYEDPEVFDQVPYRFDSKAQFADFSFFVMESVASAI